jgi:hypothetical protein
VDAGLFTDATSGHFHVTLSLLKYNNSLATEEIIWHLWDLEVHFMLSDQNSVKPSHLTHAYYMHRQFHRP